MDSYNKINRGQSNQHSNHQLNYCDESSPRESFDGNYTKSSKSNSESPNCRRRIAQSTFECRVCLNTYQSNKELHAHLHTAQHLRPLSRLNLPEDEEKIPYRKRKFHGISCKVCFHEFDTQNELKRHLLESSHHWTAKRAKQMSNHDKSAYEHKEYSDHQRYPSSTDKSFSWQNLDLSDVEESRRKDSCVRSHVSKSMDVPAPILVEDTSISDGNNFRSSKANDANVKVPMNSSKFGTDNDQSTITSPDNSILVPSKMSIELSTTSEYQKGMAVIPMEPSIPTIDPRQNFPHERPESDRREPRNLSKKWAPTYCDRPKPSLVEKRIPWKLIPIDLSPTNHPGYPFSDSRTSIPRVSSPTEDVQDVSIDQLAAQLKENTGATFIPNLRTEGNFSHSPVSFEGNLLSQLNRELLSTNANSLEERGSLQSSIPCPDGAKGGIQGHTVTKTVEYPDGKSVIGRTGESMDNGSWQYNSSLRSPSSPNSDHGTSSDKTTVVEVLSVPSKVIPPLIPPPVIDHQVEAAILQALGSLNSILSASESLSPIQSVSSQVLISNSPPLMDALQSPVFVDRDKSQHVTSFPITEKDVQSVESCLFQISGESVKEVANVDSSVSSPASSPKPTEHSVTTEVFDLCPSCQTLLDIRCLMIDLKTGNASITCLRCDAHIVMANVFKKVR